MSTPTRKSTALMASAILVGGLGLSASAFAMTDLAQGYLLGAGDAAKPTAAEGKCGEGKCGMARMDTDKDGAISKAEYTAAHKGQAGNFDSHDTDKDGSISAAEMKAHMEAKCGAGMKAGAGKGAMEGKCGEGKCGADMKPAATPPAPKAADKAAGKGAMEGKCGEGKCGSM